MLPGSKTWNVNMINLIFSQDVANQNLHTPLVPTVTEDRRVWKAENNGIYSVKSAYRMHE